MRRFPVHPDKSPDTQGLSWQGAEWSEWRPLPGQPYGIAVPEGYVVVDVDYPDKAPSLPETYGYESLSGRGSHYWYRGSAPAGHRPWGDLKGPGGYVIIPDLQDDPASQLRDCAELPPVPPPLSDGAGRNAYLTKLAGTAVRGGLDVRSELVWANAFFGEELPQRELDAIIRSADKWDRPATASGLEVHSFADLLANPPPDPVWAVDGLVPAGLTVLAGRPKAGKSWMVLDLVTTCAMGGKFLDRSARRQSVLYMAAEDSPSSLHNRLRGLYLARGGTQGVSGHYTTAVSSSSILEALSGSYNLVVVDTLGRVVEDDPDASNGGYGSTYKQLAVWQTAAKAANVALVLVHHTHKGNSTSAIGAVLGSQAIAGACDALLVLQRDEESDTGKLAWRGRDLADDHQTLYFSGHVWKTRITR